MITLERTISADGDPAAAGVKSVSVEIDAPLFDFERVESGDLVRRSTPSTVSASFTQTVDKKTYRVSIAEPFADGADGPSPADEYLRSAIGNGNLDALTETLAIVYAAADGQPLGGETADVLMLPTIRVDLDRRSMLEAVRGPLPASQYFVVSRARYVALRSKVEKDASDITDALLLAVLSAMTVVVEGEPTYNDAAEPTVREWLGIQTSAAEADAVLTATKERFAELTDVKLTVPQIDQLTIAGEVTIQAPAGTKISAKDFAAFELAAEWRNVDSPAATQLTKRLPSDVAVNANTAAFTLTDGVVLRNSVQDPVVVRVRGLDGTLLWSKEFARDDPALTKLQITVPIQSRTTLTAPSTPPLEPDLRLRGRILTFEHDCVLKDALVLVQAKSSADSPWRVVGAATTDASGNFGMPYPYGDYVAAQAVVSLAPAQPVDIAIVADSGRETISEDFLYLLVRNPQCTPAVPSTEDCECSTVNKPNRLPDFSDLIGSDEYSQDIGGSCVNLSKPNRTINEFNFQAIVRASDPDVATYTLTRHETGLETIDVSLVASLIAAGAALDMAAKTARTAAQSARDANPSVGADYSLKAMNAAWTHVSALDGAFASNAPPITMTVLADARTHVQSVIAVLTANKNLIESNDLGTETPEARKVVAAAESLDGLVTLAIDTAGGAAYYDLTGGSQTRLRKPIAIDNPVQWQDAPERPVLALAAGSTGASANAFTGHAMMRAAEKNYLKFQYDPRPSSVTDPSATFAQAVSVATGHILHYTALFKADGYSLGDLIYSLPLAPGQKKEIVIFDSTQSLVGAETQAITQNERLAMGLVDERDITSQLAGSIAESLRGQSTAYTRGISAGFGTGGQGYGGTGAYGGSGSAVLGVAGGVAQAGSDATQDSSRDVAQFFGEKLRQSIMQNAEGYRQLNASVVSTVQQGQRYGVTSEVVANHNHCHALTMMYFEVLRHYAIFQELSSVEECIFVPLLLTRFTTENVAKWRDVLAPALLPMPSETYLQPFVEMAGPGRQHPLIKAFDADQRIRTNYANVDFPAGAYDDEPIRFVKGSVDIRIDLKRPRTRYDRIKSLPVVTKTVTEQGDVDVAATVKASWFDAVAVGLTAGLSALFKPPGPNVQYQTKEYQVEVKQAIFDSFMTLDANYQSVSPAECIRVTNFSPPSISFGGQTVAIPQLDFFLDGSTDRDLWTHYAQVLGKQDAVHLLNEFFKDRLISEWDEIFYTDIAPLVFREIVDDLRLASFNADFTSEVTYTGGERVITLFVSGDTSLKRNQLPRELQLLLNSPAIKALAQDVTLNVENVRLEYSTAHYNGLLYSGTASVHDDLWDGVKLYIPESPDEKRNPRREDRYLAAKLIEHLNSNLEHYNKVLWTQLDPDRRFTLLDGFSIQVFNDDGTPVQAPAGMRSLASVVKNDLIAVAGNSLVFPVAPGYRVSGSFIQQASKNGAEKKAPASLFDHYKPLTPVEPYRVSVPSKGVFGEAVQGSCNACEKLETDRLQDWSRYPIGDEPAAIMPVTVPTPTITDWQAAFKDFATPIVNVQNAPGTPAPGAGLAGLSDLLAQSGVFKDITGLDANQQNVLKTYLSNQENAKAFAEMAKEMAMQSHNTQNSGKIMDSITSAKNSGTINQEDAGKLVKDHLQQQIDGGAGKKIDAEAAKQAAATPLSKAAIEAASHNKDVTASRVDSDGNRESVAIKGGDTSKVLAEVVGAVPPIRQKVNDCWAVTAAMMVGWKTNNAAISVADVVERAGQHYLALYQAKQTLTGADQDDFLLRLKMVGEPPRSYTLDEYIGFVNTYGPIWITTDSGSRDDDFSPHARVLIRISGTGTPDGVGTDLTFIDPTTGTEVTQPFLEFIKGFEDMAREDHSRVLTPQVVHFIQKLAPGVGFQIQGPFDVHSPIHETITLAALMNDNLPIPQGVKVGSDQAVNEFLRGVIWNDDPAVLMFDEDVENNWNFSSGISWGFEFELAKFKSENDRTNLTGRSHFNDLQFLHAMAKDVGEAPEDTLAKIMLWAEVMYRLSTDDGVAPTDKLEQINIKSSASDAAGKAYSYRMSNFFDDTSRPRGKDTINYLLTLDTKCRFLDLSRRAIGSLLHVVEDSYARGHVRRTLTNPQDLLDANVIDEFKAGTYGKWGEVENFHCYRGQDEDMHDKYDQPPPYRGVKLNASDLSSFNLLLGGRDAIDAATQLLNMWLAKTAWDANGGPKEFLEGTIFKLSANATPADTTV
ncbi:MAG TPA: papain-like cysteine protease family protein [Gaiellaceae bacterium]|jgi:hypothetical protein